MNFIDRIGNRNPEILLLLNSFILFDQQKYLGIYLLFWIVNYNIIKFTKNIIKEPRPIGFSYKKNDDGYDYSNSYGMPSGHSGLVFYSTVFLWLVKKSISIFILELFMCFITLYQRYSYKKHTIQQLFAGALLGSTIAYIGFYTGKEIFKI
jgi:membrane-associated phospholipid phosphatase